MNIFYKTLVITTFVLTVLSSGSYLTQAASGFLDTISASLGLHIEGNAGVADNLYVGEKVGVGTVDPTESLDVVGKVKTTGGIIYGDGSVQTQAYDGRGEIKKDMLLAENFSGGEAVYVTSENGQVKVKKAAGQNANQAVSYTDNYGKNGAVLVHVPMADRYFKIGEDGHENHYVNYLSDTSFASLGGYNTTSRYNLDSISYIQDETRQKFVMFLDFSGSSDIKVYNWDLNNTKPVNVGSSGASMYIRYVKAIHDKNYDKYFLYYKDGNSLKAYSANPGDDPLNFSAVGNNIVQSISYPMDAFYDEGTGNHYVSHRNDNGTHGITAIDWNGSGNFDHLAQKQYPSGTSIYKMLYAGANKAMVVYSQGSEKYVEVLEYVDGALVTKVTQSIGAWDIMGHAISFNANDNILIIGGGYAGQGAFMPVYFNSAFDESTAGEKIIVSDLQTIRTIAVNGNDVGIIGYNTSWQAQLRLYRFTSFESRDKAFGVIQEAGNTGDSKTIMFYGGISSGHTFTLEEVGEPLFIQNNGDLSTTESPYQWGRVLDTQSALLY